MAKELESFASMDALERDVALQQITYQLRLHRLAGGISKAALSMLIDLEKDLVASLAGAKLTTWGKARTQAFLKEVHGTITEAYQTVQQSIDVGGVAALDAQATAKILEGVLVGTLPAVAVGLPTATVLNAIAASALIEGTPAAAWWSRQSGDLAFKFSGIVRQGFVSGETNAQLITKVRAAMGVSKRNADALVRTSVMAVARDARLATYRENPDIIQGVRQISTLDSRTTDICMAYSGGTWALDGKPLAPTTLAFNGGPPRHWRCRSTLTSVLKPIPGMPDLSSLERAAKGGPVRGDITFDEWLDTQPKATSDEMLGKGRAQLWRDKKLTLAQLLDSNGRPLTLAELKELYR